MDCGDVMLNVFLGNEAEGGQTNLYLRGGHWCPTCMIDQDGYAAQADRNPFFAQVWTQERSA